MEIIKVFIITVLIKSPLPCVCVYIYNITLSKHLFKALPHISAYTEKDAGTGQKNCKVYIFASFSFFNLNLFILIGG